MFTGYKYECVKEFTIGITGTDYFVNKSLSDQRNGHISLY